MHWTHWLLAVSQYGFGELARHVELSTHGTQVFFGPQTVPAGLPAQFAFVRHSTQKPPVVSQ